MSKSKKKPLKPKARLPRGFRDVTSDELRRLNAMLATIGRVFDSYGFEPLETPAFEFTDALGKFLPDQDRPNAGVFSLQDDDEQWMSLRYDMTAPLARYVAENYQFIAKPFRRYTTGPVWRNEKPGPGRFRQFTQFDADTVGTANIAADAEICMLVAETLEAIGIARGDYIVRANNRVLLDALLAKVGIDPADGAVDGPRLTVLRAMDKLDRLGPEGVALLLGEGRKDDSGDYTKGAGLTPAAIDQVLAFLGAGADGDPVDALERQLGDTAEGADGLQALSDMQALARAAGFDADRFVIDPSVVRGLEYYTGPVFEAELTFDVKDEAGNVVRFGSVGGGGRYDDLVARFTGQQVPATGVSLGVSRLSAALALTREAGATDASGPVVVLAMEPDRMAAYMAMVAELRASGVRAEVYLGTSGMKAQMKYADRRNAPCVIIEGEDERASGLVQVKDLKRGAELSAEIESSEEWRAARPAQVSVARSELVATVRGILDQQTREGGGS